jgi:hypothetical protein
VPKNAAATPVIFDLFCMAGLTVNAGKDYDVLSLFCDSMFFKNR